jgi:hypothetical protein
MPPEGIRRHFRFFRRSFLFDRFTGRTSGRLASLETTVITPRPGWQNQSLSADPFLMQREHCKSSRPMPEKSFASHLHLRTGRSNWLVLVKLPKRRARKYFWVEPSLITMMPLPRVFREITYLF